jgi:hypothetical protein
MVPNYIQIVMRQGVGNLIRVPRSLIDKPTCVCLYLINLPVYALLGKESKIRRIQERGMIIRIIPEVYMYIHTHTHIPRGVTQDKTRDLKTAWFTQNSRHPICKALMPAFST